MSETDLMQLLQNAVDKARQAGSEAPVEHITNIDLLDIITNNTLTRLCNGSISLASGDELLAIAKTTSIVEQLKDRNGSK